VAVTGTTAGGPSGSATSTPAGRAGRLPRVQRREQVLAAAQEVFVASGYHAASMDEIADRAGVSKPVLYQHFPGKLELYLALLDAHLADLVSRVRDALASTADNHERVAASVSAYFDFVAAQGDTPSGAYRLVFESDLRNDPLVRERVERNLADCAEAITDAIAADTGVRREEARLLSVGLTGIAEVAARWWLVSHREVPRERAVELLVGLAWRGISGSPRASGLPPLD
jgi:AcrR family transcriptional regulator